MCVTMQCAHSADRIVACLKMLVARATVASNRSAAGASCVRSLMSRHAHALAAVDVVSMEKFGHFLNWFGPIDDASGGALAVLRRVSVCGRAEGRECVTYVCARAGDGPGHLPAALDERSDVTRHAPDAPTRFPRRHQLARGRGVASWTAQGCVMCVLSCVRVLTRTRRHVPAAHVDDAVVASVRHIEDQRRGRYEPSGGVVV
jgi:hypothetical protein